MISCPNLMWSDLGAWLLTTRLRRSRFHGRSGPALHSIEHGAQVVVNEADVIFGLRSPTRHNRELDKFGSCSLGDRLCQTGRGGQFAYDKIYLLLAHPFFKVRDVSMVRVHAGAD